MCDGNVCVYQLPVVLSILGPLSVCRLTFDPVAGLICLSVFFFYVIREGSESFFFLSFFKYLPTSSFQ